jgi:hypothetical protein
MEAEETFAPERVNVLWYDPARPARPLHVTLIGSLLSLSTDNYIKYRYAKRPILQQSYVGSSLNWP